MADSNNPGTTVMIEKLSFRKFSFNLEAVDDLQVPPYKGAMFRGAFGMAFRGSVCATGLPECGNCHLKNTCIYFRYFESEMPAEGLPFLDGPRKVPHPFVLHPPLNSAVVFPSGYRFSVGVTLIGSAVVDLPYFIHTFRKLASEGLGKGKKKAALLSVDDITRPEKLRVYSTETGRLVPGHEAISFPEITGETPSPVTRVTLDFLTPFRIQHKGTELRNKEEVQSHKIITLAQRRLMALAYLYCDAVPVREPRNDGSHREIVSNSLVFHDWERYSNRHRHKMNMGGFLGKIVIEGDLDDVAPVLMAGSYVNIGKNTLFGLGQYSVKFN